MNILFLNASPKKKRSNSGVFVNIVKMLLFPLSPRKIKTIRLPVSNSYDEILSCFKEIDCLVIASPVYVDTLPSHLLKFLSNAEIFCKENNLHFKVYAIFNCGFFEGRQCKNAFSVLKCWCKKAEVQYGSGVGIGGGEMLGMLHVIFFYLIVLVPLIKMIIGIFYIPVEKLSLPTVVASFDWRYMVNNLLVYLVLSFGMLVSLFRLRLRISKKQSIKEIYTFPIFPKTLFIIMANVIWIVKAILNGTSIYRIYKREYVAKKGQTQTSVKPDNEVEKS